MATPPHMGWGKYLRPARSGEVVWGPERVRPGTYSASPVLADGKIYVTSEDGVTSVVEAGPRFKLVAENELEGYVLTGHLGGADLCPNGEVPVLHRRAPALVRATFHVPRCRSWVLGSGFWKCGIPEWEGPQGRDRRAWKRSPDREGVGDPQFLRSLTLPAPFWGCRPKAHPG